MLLAQVFFVVRWQSPGKRWYSYFTNSNW